MVTIGEKLTQWFEKNKRDLPWRKTKDPYAVLLSELMLQQTTVRVVIPYFEKFLKRFPKIQDLAKAKESDVLGLWSGLGYYTRARNLYKLANVLKGKPFPDEYEKLLELPGIGPYTAAAVASIAFSKPVACVDGNVIRVITRVEDIATDVSTKETKKLIQDTAQKWLHTKNPSAFNQAMMELGATICTPKSPLCLLCPLQKDCKAFAHNTQHLRPVKPKRRKMEPWLWQMEFHIKNGRIALVQTNNGTPWLKNSWVLPGRAEKMASTKVPDHDFQHAITHHKIFVKVSTPKTAAALKKINKSFGPDLRWVSIKQLEKLGVSSVVHKVLSLEPVSKKI